MTDYKAQYLSLCADLNNGDSKKDIQKHNSAMKKLSQLFHYVKNEQDKSFLLELLENEDDTVSSLVAAHCLGLKVYLKEAKKVLTRISKSKENLDLAIDAEITLDIWKKQGFLDF